MLRRANKNDVKGISKAHVDTWRSTYKDIISKDFLSKMTYEKRELMWDDILSQETAPAHTLVATDTNSTIIGFSSGGKNRDASLAFDGEIYALYLLPSEQKKGLGKKLFLESLEQLYRDGFYKMVLWTLEKNPTRHFYEAMGGKAVGEKWSEVGEEKLKQIAYGWTDIFETLKNLKKNFRHPCIKHFSEIKEPCNPYKGEEIFGESSPLGRYFRFKRIGIHYCVLEPGQRTSLPHAEKTEDEYILVVKGHPHAWIDGKLYQLRPGDSVGFSSGTGISHTFINNSDEKIDLLVVGDKTREDNKYFYPLDEQQNKQIGEYFWHDHPHRFL